MDVKADPAILDGQGAPDIREVQPLIWDPARQRYYGVGPLLGGPITWPRTVGN